MITLEKAEEKLRDTIKHDKVHQDFERVVSLADEYTKLFTGKDIESLLRQFATRESKEMFDQRVAIYQTVMGAVANNLSTVFKKPLRSTRIYKSIETENEDKYNKLVEALKKFWASGTSEGVDAFLESRWFDLTKVDPNAFIAVEFDEVQPGVYQPYPVEYSSKEAIMYQYKNGVLVYLICKIPHVYKVRTGSSTKPQEKNGHRYLLFTDLDAVEYRQVDRDAPAEGEVGENDEVVIVTDDLKFVRNIYNHKVGVVPAVRVGVEQDSVTKGRTSLSIFHAAVPFFKKELKAGSELDISMAMHAFPQKIAYGKRCKGNPEEGIICKDGYTANGEHCPVCKGTMVAPVHTTGQDVQIVPFPTRSDEPLLDLEKLVAYKTPSIELLKFQDEYVDKLTEKARKAIFGGITLIQKSGLKTATEADYAMEDIYDALLPFCRKYSSVWKYLVETSASIVGFEKGDTLSVYHKFPSDLKLKSLQQLFAERKEAKDAMAPDYVLNAIDNDILDVQYADDQDTLFKLKVKNSFMPFKGKSTLDVQSIISSGRTTRYFEILYNHFSIVFDRIDEELGDKFYLMTLEKQKAEVLKQVEILDAQINTERNSRLSLPIEG